VDLDVGGILPADGDCRHEVSFQDETSLGLRRSDALKGDLRAFRSCPVRTPV